MKSKLNRKRKLVVEENEKFDEPNEKNFKFMSASELRKKLHGPSPCLSSLKDFLKGESELERIGDYINEGGSIAELLILLNNIDVRENVTAAVTVFRAIRLFIIKCLSDFPSKTSQLVEECRQLLSIHLQFLISLLGAHSSVKLKRVSLELLTVIVSCHESLGWEVLGKCSISRLDIAGLVSANKYQDPFSVRETFIQFILSFLIDQSPNLIKKLITNKVLITSIFPGLVRDSFENILLLLDAFKKNIVEAKEITKSVKLIVFNTSTLCNLFALFSWDPTFGATHAGRVDPSKKELVRQRLEDLLTVLLTSLKAGVIFLDTSFGTSGKVINDVVANLVKSSGQPWGDILKEKVYIKMLCACPDVIKIAYKQYEPYLGVNLTPQKWCQVVNFMADLIQALNIDSTSLSSRCKLQIKYLYAPEILLKTLRVNLLSEFEDKKHSSLRCLSVCLNKLKHFNISFRDPSLLDLLINNLTGTAQDLIDLIIQNSESFNVQSLMHTIDSLLDLYTICPQLLDAIRFNDEPNEGIQNCINVIKKVDINSEEKDLRRNLACLKLMQLTFIVWNVNHNHEKFGFWLEDLCYFMLPEKEILDISLKIMDQTLSSTGFLGCAEELKLWLYSLSVCNNVDVGKLIVNSIKYATIYLKSLYKDMKKIEKSVSSVDQPSRHLSLDDYITASMNSNDVNHFSTVDHYCSNSILILSLLKNLHSNPNDFQECEHFVITLLVNVFHHHASMYTFLSTLKFYSSHEGVQKVMDYIESWVSGHGVPLDIEPSFKNTNFHNVSCWLLNISDNNPLEGIMIADCEAELLLRQCIFYLSCQKISPHRASFFIRELVASKTHLSSNILSYPFLFSMFSPLNDPSNFNNSSLVVLEFLRFNNSSKIFESFQHKFAFELRCSLLQKSSLKKCYVISDLIDLLGIPEKEVMDLIQLCCPLPERCLKGFSSWFQIIAYLLQKSVEINAKLPDENLILLLKQALPLLPDVTPEMFICDALALYLSHFKDKIVFSEEQLNVINELLLKLCSHNIWFENLAIELCSHVCLIDFSQLSLERAIPLISSVRDEGIILQTLIKIIESNYKTICFKITHPDSECWIQQFESLVKNYDLPRKSLKKLRVTVMNEYKDTSLVVHSFKFLCTLFEKSGHNDDFFSLITFHLINFKDWQNHELLNLLLNKLKGLLERECGRLTHDMCKHIILEGLRQCNSNMISLLLTSVTLELTDMNNDEIFDHSTSHSLFLDTILDGDFGIKLELLKLIKELILKEKSLMKSSHIPVYLGSYNASLSATDQVILQILRLYEENGVSFLEWRPFVWSQLAIQRYSVREVKKRVDITNSPTIDLLDIGRINATITNFPSGRSSRETNILEYPDGENIYDPSFILPAVAQAIGPTSDVKPRKVTLSGAISLALCSLNSFDEEIRSVSYHVLHKFYQSLTDRSGDSVWLNFIETIQRSISGEENIKLSGILSVFLARATIIMSEPLNPLYKPMHNFILARNTFRLEDVPAFLELFQYTNVEKNLSQIWILEVIRDGVRDSNDFQIILRSNTIKLLMSFYNSDLSSPPCRVIIEDILKNCLQYGDKRHCFLTKEYSLIPWLIFVDKLHIAFETIPNISKFIN